MCTNPIVGARMSKRDNGLGILRVEATLHIFDEINTRSKRPNKINSYRVIEGWLDGKISLTERYRKSSHFEPLSRNPKGTDGHIDQTILNVVNSGGIGTVPTQRRQDFVSQKN